MMLEGSYCDFYGTREQAIATTTGAIEQIQIDSNAGKHSPEVEKKQEFYKELLKTFGDSPGRNRKRMVHQ